MRWRRGRRSPRSGPRPRRGSGSEPRSRRSWSTWTALGRDGERLSPGGFAEGLDQRLADWQGLLQRQPIQAREILKKLVEGRLVFGPFGDGMAAGYRTSG